MDTRKIVHLLVLLNLSFFLGLGTSARNMSAKLRPYNQTKSVITTQSSRDASITQASVPMYDSGWKSISIRPDPISITFTHNLGGDPDTYYVSLECRDNTTLGTYNCANNNFNTQAFWYGLTDTTVSVYVAGGILPNAVRIRIYSNQPAYDGGWESISIRPDPIPVVFTHNLGGDPDTYHVSLECRDNSTLGTYDCTNYSFNTQAFWFGLTNTTANVYVAGGSVPDAVRIRIYSNPPTYDSGWESINIRPDPIPVVFTHNLGGDPDTYQVSLECRDNSTLGTYDCTSYSFNTQAFWFGLTGTTANAYVAGGSVPDAVRIRIWRVSDVYLPIIVRP